MPPKPNYNHQRAERDRAKQAKKQEKLQEKREQSALRKAAQTDEPQPADEPASGSDQ